MHFIDNAAFNLHSLSHLDIKSSFKTLWLIFNTKSVLDLFSIFIYLYTKPHINTEQNFEKLNCKGDFSLEIFCDHRFESWQPCLPFLFDSSCLIYTACFLPIYVKKDIVITSCYTLKLSFSCRPLITI